MSGKVGGACARTTPPGGSRGATPGARYVSPWPRPGPVPALPPAPSSGPPPPALSSWASDAGAAAAAFHRRKPAAARVLLLLPPPPSASLSARRRRAGPGHAKRRGDPAGSVGGRAQRRSGLGGAGAASAPFPEVSLPGELSPPPGPEGRLCVSGARGWLSGHGRARTSAGTRASARPPAPTPAGVSAASRAVLRKAAWLCGRCPGREDQCPARRSARKAEALPPSKAAARYGRTGLAEVGFLRSCSRSRVCVSFREPQRRVASSVAETFLIMWAEATSCFVLF